MKFINTDGMAFIGPGSEWFWTALSGIVLAVTFLAIYRQLVMARSASTREQISSWDREWSSERLIRYRLAILVALRGPGDHAHLPDGAVGAIADWWETIGQLARNGDYDIQHLYRGYSEACQVWWAILAPSIQRARVERGTPQLIADFEWLARLSAEKDRRNGKLVVDETMLGPLDVAIGSLRERLHVEQSLRSVVVVSPEALPASAPPTPAP